MLILAPSATGKTTLVETINSKYVLDGDDVVATALGGWPEGKWWITMSPEEKTTFLGKVWPIILNAAQDNVVLFGVNPTTLFSEIVSDVGYDSGIYVWIPTAEDLTRNVNSRRESGVENQPIDVEPVLQARDQMKEFSLGSKLVENTLSSESEVDSLIRSWLIIKHGTHDKLKPVRVGSITVDSSKRYLAEFMWKGSPVLATADERDYRRVEWGGSIDISLLTNGLRLYDPLAHTVDYNRGADLCSRAFWWAYRKVNNPVRGKRN